MPTQPPPATAYRALVAGTWASALSAIALAVAGHREAHSATAPINAVSHWYWGDEALRRQGVDVAHTLAGYATHHGASVFWAALLAAYLGRYPHRNTPPRIACFTDFKLTPHRFTPGYEHRLSRKALGATYLLFAAGLALGA